MTEKSCALLALELVMATKEARTSLREFKSTKSALVDKPPTLSDLKDERNKLTERLPGMNESCAEFEQVKGDIGALDIEIKDFGKVPSVKPTLADLDRVRLVLDAHIVSVQALLHGLGKCGLTVTKTINRGQRARTSLDLVIKNLKTGGVAASEMAIPYKGRDVMAFLNKAVPEVVKTNTETAKTPVKPAVPSLANPIQQDF